MLSFLCWSLLALHLSLVSCIRTMVHPASLCHLTLIHFFIFLFLYTHNQGASPCPLPLDTRTLGPSNFNCLSSSLTLPFPSPPQCIDCKSDLGGSRAGAEVRIRNKQLYCNFCYMRFKSEYLSHLMSVMVYWVWLFFKSNIAVSFLFSWPANRYLTWLYSSKLMKKLLVTTTHEH